MLLVVAQCTHVPAACESRNSAPEAAERKEFGSGLCDGVRGTTSLFMAPSFTAGCAAVQMSKSYSLFNNLLKYRILRIIDLEKFIRELVKRAIFPDILDIGKG